MNENKPERKERPNAGRLTTALVKLLEVKSIVTILMTAALVTLLFWPHESPRELVALFSSLYGAVITYFFTRKDNNNNG